jgi:ABC-type amino acid transport substrate-binding protein
VKFDVTGFGLRNPTSGDVEGLDADLGREIAKDMGVRPVFIEAVSANRIPFLQQDKVDLIISTFTINEERKQQIDFSVPYYIAGQSILVKKESTIQSVTDLNGKKVCSGEGSTSEKNVRTKAPQAQLLLFKTYTEAGQALSDGRCDAVSTDDSILFGLAEKIPGTELRGGVFTEEPLGIGVKKGRTDLVDFVNATLRKMKDDGRLKAAYDKHIKRFTGQDVTVPF